MKIEIAFLPLASSNTRLCTGQSDGLLRAADTRLRDDPYIADIYDPWWFDEWTVT